MVQESTGLVSSSLVEQKTSSLSDSVLGEAAQGKQEVVSDMGQQVDCEVREMRRKRGDNNNCIRWFDWMMHDDWDLTRRRLIKSEAQMTTADVSPKLITKDDLLYNTVDGKTVYHQDTHSE